MKIILLILSIIVVGCGSAEMSKEIKYYGFDFRPYNKEGFLITTEGYASEYESIGLLSAVLFPEVKKIDDKATIQGWRYATSELLPTEVIDSLFHRAKNMGADAIIKFDLRDVYKTRVDRIVQGIEAFGFAIKRKPLEVKLVK